ncbi:protein DETOXIFICATION 48-like [Salvia miltiorrhiza]|uniref:protein DETOXIFICATION 48-like n=1 Tax=Salvia miltiorrhiza TaxID=226208 RepID=UPI0025ABF678|nr:protein DETOXIFICATION 48-like [Salvia miltiorrhiza]
MCHLKPTPLPSYSPTSNKSHIVDPPTDDQELHRWPTASQVIEEVKAIGKISGPTTITGLILFSRSMISMLFLGYLGDLELAGGALAIGIANITGYAVLSGLAMGMDPICAQAYGADQMNLLALTLHRTIALLLAASLPIAAVWFNINHILLWCNQDAQISSVAQNFVAFAIPDLFFLSFLHPLRIFLRAQGVTLPVMALTFAAILLHIPANFMLVKYLELGVAGVALATALTDLNLILFLCLFVRISGVCERSWISPTAECLRGWSALLSLAVPACVSVCLEWWWYELMIVLCGLLANPRATISSMGILIQTTSFMYVFPSALSLGVATRVGNELGAGRPARARVASIAALLCAAAMGVAAVAFATAMRERWGRLFTDDGEILKLTAAALPIAGLCELGNCPQTAAGGVLRGSARAGVGARVNLGSFYLVGMPAAFVMGFGMGMGFRGLWVGLLAAQVSCAAAMVAVLWRTDWREEMERGREVRGVKKRDGVSDAQIIYRNDEMMKLQTQHNPLILVVC